MENENIENLDQIGIGNRETTSLQAKPVAVVGHRIEEVTNKAKEKVGKKVVLICKHPDKTDKNIEISQVKYLKGDKIASSGLWFNLDEDNKIPKQSALAITLGKYGCSTIAELDGKTVLTDLSNNYLVVKAY